MRELLAAALAPSPALILGGSCPIGPQLEVFLRKSMRIDHLRPSRRLRHLPCLPAGVMLEEHSPSACQTDEQS